MRIACQIQKLLLGAAVAALLAGCATANGAPIRSGQAAPALAVITLAGAPSEVRSQPGQVLWLNFWASRCYPCRAEWPGLNQAQRNLAGEGLQLVAISVNERPDVVKQFLDTQPASFEVTLDPHGQAAARYGVIGFPTHVLIDTTGVVRAVVRGPLDEARARRLLGLD